MKQSFINKTHNIKTQAFRYLVVGGFAFIVDFTIFSVLTEIFSVHYLTANVFSFLSGLMSNYFMSIRWVFATRNINNKYWELLLFSLVGIAGLIINQFILWFCISYFSIYVLLSKVIAAIVVFFWNFFARRAFVFYTTTKAVV